MIASLKKFFEGNDAETIKRGHEYADRTNDSTTHESVGWRFNLRTGHLGGTREERERTREVVAALIECMDALEHLSIGTAPDGDHGDGCVSKFAKKALAKLEKSLPAWGNQ